MKLDVFLKKLAKASIPTGALEVELPDAKGEKKEVDINATKVVKSALDSFLKRAAEFLPEGVDAKQLEMGKEVEKEHKKTYDQIQEYFNKNNSLPSFDQVAEWIALDHLNEPGNEEYYTKLQTIEKKAGVADFLKRLGTKAKPEPKPEGLLKLIGQIKGGAFNLNKVLKELDEKAIKGAMTSTVKNPVKNMYNQMGGTVPTKDVLDYWLKREGRRIVR